MTATDVEAPVQDETTEDASVDVDNDLGVILPEPGKMEIGGIPVEVRRLKTREFLLLMRVITGGMGASMRDIRLNTKDEEAMVADLISIVMLAIPFAIEEFGEFVISIVEAKNKHEHAAQLRQALENPEIEDLMNIIGIVVEQERDDLGVLAGKARAWIAKIQTTMNRPSTA